jgi:hypothetical protein
MSPLSNIIITDLMTKYHSQISPNFTYASLPHSEPCHCATDRVSDITCISVKLLRNKIHRT